MVAKTSTHETICQIYYLLCKKARKKQFILHISKKSVPLQAE